jgi:cytochrome c-type biogenesis protein
VIQGLSLPLVFLAGLVSFASPCVLPLLPGYVAIIGGAGASRIRASLLFLAGFVVVFIALGATASTLGGLLVQHRRALDIAAGTLIALMGLVLLGALASPFSGRVGALTLRLGERARTRGGPLALGVAFAFCWTPCIGPVLASVLAYAASRGTLRDGVALLLVYALGLAAPFLAASLLMDRARVTGPRVRHLARLAHGVSGGLLVGMGILVISGKLWIINADAQRALTAVGLDWWTGI